MLSINLRRKELMVEQSHNESFMKLRETYVVFQKVSHSQTSIFLTPVTPCHFFSFIISNDVEKVRKKLKY